MVVFTTIVYRRIFMNNNFEEETIVDLNATGEEERNAVQDPL